MEDAKEEKESWRSLCNGEGPHSALVNLSPREFALLAEKGDLTCKTSSMSGTGGVQDHTGQNPQSGWLRFQGQWALAGPPNIKPESKSGFRKQNISASQMGQVQPQWSVPLVDSEACESFAI